MRPDMMTLEQLKVEVRSRSQAELFELLRQCEKRRHTWLPLESDPVAPGGRAQYCKRCLRVRIVPGAEYWPVQPEK
jgi:protein involved in temperature-dependent protein secretion